MDKDDFLLTQIDEFREKAKRLQGDAQYRKNQKLRSFQSIVEEREAKAEELQQILDERQEKKPMESPAQVAKQIDVLIESVHEKMAEIEQSMNAGMDSLAGRQVSSDMDNLGRSVKCQYGQS